MNQSDKYRSKSTYVAITGGEIYHIVPLKIFNEMCEKLDAVEVLKPIIEHERQTITINPVNPYLMDKQVAERFSVSRTTIWRWIRTSNFPKPVKLGGSTRWRLADLEAWEKTLDQLPGELVDDQHKCMGDGK
jgi:prophage regulatory protein